MLTQSQVLQMQDRVTQTLAQAGIVLTPQEQAQIEVVDFGLSELERTGLQLVIYINNDPVRPVHSIAIRRSARPIRASKRRFAAGGARSGSM